MPRHFRDFARCRAAAERGWSPVIHLDADGQHDPAAVARFAEALRPSPGALVLGVPVFDASVPKSRLYARHLSGVVPDPLCGFPSVPLAATLAVIDRVATGDRMDFEPEISVRLAWEGMPVVALPTRVVYLPSGLSRFSFSRDYPLLASLYLRLLASMLPRAARLRRQARAARRGPAR